MTREDIIRMAEESSGTIADILGGVDIAWLTRFAKLVAAAERAKGHELLEALLLIKKNGLDRRLNTEEWEIFNTAIAKASGKTLRRNP